MLLKHPPRFLLASVGKKLAFGKIRCAPGIKNLRKPLKNAVALMFDIISV